MGQADGDGVQGACVSHPTASTVSATSATSAAPAASAASISCGSLINLAEVKLAEIWKEVRGKGMDRVRVR